MNANDIEQPIVDLAEKLPKYCNYYKHLLVEELVLEADFRQLHYGKCAVIGRLCAIPDHFKLENVTVPHLPSDCKLPTGAVSVLLLNFNYDAPGDTTLAHGNYCVVRGEVVLCNVEQPNSEFLTIRGLYEHLSLLGDDNKGRCAFLETIQRTHKPALNVWHARRIDLAEELLQSRLEVRVLCQS